jgi:hypothetical protein
MATGPGSPGYDRFRFLLRQYSQWQISSTDRESCLIGSHEVQLTHSRCGASLAILNPRWRLRGAIASLRLEKSGRCTMRLLARRLGESKLLVLSPRETARLGDDTSIRRERFQNWVSECCLDLYPTARLERRSSLRLGTQNPNEHVVGIRLQLPRAGVAIIALDKESGKAGVWSALAHGLNYYSTVRGRLMASKPLGLAFIAHRSIEGTLRRLLHWVSRDEINLKLYLYRGNSRPSLSSASDSNESFKSVSMRWSRIMQYTAPKMLQRVLDSYGPMLRRFAMPEGGTVFRFRGLDILRSRKAGGELYFGPPDFGTQLTDRSWPGFISFMEEVQRIRVFDSREKQHPFYRWQAERWLEETLLCNIDRLDPGLKPDHIYSQVPAYIGEGRAVLDLLGVRHDGRMIVIEVKVSRDPDFLVQALDYWDRVMRLNVEGEFERQGYFAGANLSREKPLLYLIAPVFCFDRRLAAQAKLLDRSIEIYRIVVSGTWRRELRVLDKQPLRFSD